MLMSNIHIEIRRESEWLTCESWGNALRAVEA